MNGPARPSYELRVDGLLGSDWSVWFDGLEVTSDGSQTVLTGAVEDQAALHGVLSKIRDLGLQLISVRRLDPGDSSDEGDQP
ncbi:MAG TPA: hypothetical protein VHX15_11400 [Frankiaceae bacterium]|jgi:hypothetical protein|nr:hypothetical protein [Frankiaceae bacterium]